MDFKEFAQGLLPEARSLVSSWLPQGKLKGRFWTTGSVHGESGKSLEVDLSTGIWKDYATDEKGGDLISLYAAIKGIKQSEAARALGMPITKPALPVPFEPNFQDSTLGAPVYTHKYLDHEGNTLMYTARYNKEDGSKEFRPFTVVNGKWVRKAYPHTRPLYGLNLLAENPNAPVLIVEGERTAELARNFTTPYVVVTWSGGAKAHDKTDWSPLFNRTKALLWPDADESGIKAMEKIASYLAGKVADIKIIRPDRNSGWDAGDAYQEGWTTEQWKSWAKALVEPYTPKVEEEKQTPKPKEAREEKIIKDFFISTERGLKPLYLEMARHLKNTHNLVITDEGNYIYTGTHYAQVSALKLEQMIYELTEGFSTPAHIDGFKKISRVHTYNKDFFSDKPRGKMNLANGLLDVKSRELSSHSPEHRQTAVLPISFDPTATAPKWEEFLNQVFLGDQDLCELTREMFGYTLLGSDPFLQRAFCLYGTGRNGKSTLLHILKCLLGKDNFSAVPMNLLDKPFSCVMLDKKLANICEETPTDRINAEIFKTAVGGGSIVAAQKGQPEFLMDVAARFIFACNELPVFKDKTKGLEDRLVLVPFELYLSDEERDFSINKKLESELSGILNWALAGAERILEWGRLTTPERSKTLKEEYKRESDSVFDYFLEFLDVSKLNEDAIPIKGTYFKYVDWCKSDGRYAVSQRAFTKGIKSHAIDKLKIILSGFVDKNEVFKETRRSFGFGKYEHAIPHVKEKS